MNAYGAGLQVPLPNIERNARAERARPPSPPPMPVRMRFDRFELDEANARLLHDGKPVDLPPKPFEVLCALARRPGSLVTKNALLDEVWGHRFVSESVLKTVVAKLRAALQDDARDPRLIETMPRRGYRLIATPTIRPEVVHMTAERTLLEIRELLLALVGQPLLTQGAAAGLVDRLAQLGAMPGKRDRSGTLS